MRRGGTIRVPGAVLASRAVLRMGRGAVAVRARAIVWLTLFSLTVALLSAEGGLPVARAQTSARPNIVVILTDDQRWDTIKMMPHVRASLVEKGMTLRGAVVSNALC